MTENVSAKELADHLARIKQDPAAWAFCLASGVMQWTANFAMMSAKRRALREWILLVQSTLLEGLVRLQEEAAAGRWRENFAEAEQALGQHRLDDAAICQAITGLQAQLREAREVRL